MSRASLLTLHALDQLPRLLHVAPVVDDIYRRADDVERRPWTVVEVLPPGAVILRCGQRTTITTATTLRDPKRWLRVPRVAPLADAGIKDAAGQPA